MRLISLTIIINFLTICMYAQNGTIEIDTIYVNEDVDKGIVLINKNVNELNSLYLEEKSIIQTAHCRYTLFSPITEFEYGASYKATDLEGKSIALYFTQLPIINIHTKNTIVDEPKVYAQFSLCESNGNYIESGIGIEFRGRWTQSLPKKSLKIEFWQDETGSATKDLSLLKMRSDDDWDIQAMYNEPLRLRSMANFEMWRKIDTLYYQADEPAAVNGVRQEYIELFINKQYKGLYALSEKIDRKQLKLKKFKDSKIRGELYKGVGWGASTYKSFPVYNNSSDLWGGFEYKYPDEKIEWSNIHEFVNFVVNADSVDFYTHYHEKFNIDNAVNYFIFLNVLRITDNTGKNIMVAKYNNNEPYFNVPYDLDGSYGIIWNGTRENITNDILSNGFYNRLLKHDYFTNKLKARWDELREDIITLNGIMGTFNTQFQYLKSNGVYERELIAWPNCEFIDFDNLEYTSTWLSNRLSYLDIAFNNQKQSTDIKRITQQNQVILYPNPTSDYLTIKTEDISIIENIKIINSMGVSVYNNNRITGSIDVSAFRNGAYIIIIDYSYGERQVEKVMIKRE